MNLRKYLLFIGVVLFPTGLWAEPPPASNTEMFQNWAKQAKAYVEAEKGSLQDFAQPDPQKVEPARREAEALRDDVLQQAGIDEPPEQVANMCPSNSVLLFISQSLGEAALKDILQTAALYSEQHVHLVFRGVPDGMKIDQVMHWIHSMIAGMDPPPNVELGPMLFREYHVDTVPTMVYVGQPYLKGRDCKFNEISRVQGLSDPSFYLSRQDADFTPDYGVKGPVEDIAERDLIELMQERVMAIDWAEKQKRALDDYWYKYDFPRLEKAANTRTRRIDATVVAAENITDDVGNILVPAGTEKNPLSEIPWMSDVIVFDATDPRQVDWAESQVKPRIDKRPIVVLSKLDPKEGFKQIDAISRRFGVPVYTMIPEIIQRFELEYVPALVTADTHDYIVTEQALAVSLPDAPIVTDDGNSHAND